MNINKICSKCKQIVYPLEQLNCLDQYWHKRCFRCENCGMALNVGNYRGYEKKPYCIAHYPQPKRFTVVADTPEFQRAAQNTRLFSTVNYDQRHSKNGSMDRRATTPGRLTSAQSVSGTHPSETENPGRLRQGSRTYQLYQMGQSLPSEGLRQQNGGSGSRHVYSSSSVSPSQQRTSSEAYDSSADAHSPVHHSTAASQGQQAVDWGQHQQVNESLNHMVPSSNKVASQTRHEAMYDYGARDFDEVSFRQGDIIVDGCPITDGWMYGTVHRTGQRGMLPSNYVRPSE